MGVISAWDLGGGLPGAIRVRFWSRSGVTGGVSGGVSGESGVRGQSAVVGMSRARENFPPTRVGMSGESVQNFAPARGDASRRVTEIFTGGSREGDENFLVASPKSLRRRKNLREKICAGRVTSGATFCSRFSETCGARSRPRFQKKFDQNGDTDAGRGVRLFRFTGPPKVTDFP